MHDLLLTDELRGELGRAAPLAARAAQDEGIAAILDDRIRHRAAVGARNLADLLVKDVLTIGVVVDLARPLVADALARAVGRSPRDAAALPPREDLDVQKILRHRAVRRRAARRPHGCPNRAKAQIPSLMRCSDNHARTWLEIHPDRSLKAADPCYRSGSRGIAQ